MNRPAELAGIHRAVHSFQQNGSGYLFASGIGVPNGSGGYFTGDVVTSGPLSPVPLPAAAWLFISGFASVRFITRKRIATDEGCSERSSPER